jgi:hypothetical protein
MKPLIYFLASVLALAALRAPAAAEDFSGGWPGIIRQPTARIQRILGVKPEGAAPLDLLASVIAGGVPKEERAWDFSRKEPEIEELAARLVQGADLEPLWRSGLPSIAMPDGAAEARPCRYGGDDKRGMLAWWMARKAREIRADKPDQAAVYAKAAIILDATTCGFAGSPLSVAEGLISDGQLATLVGLDSRACSSLYFLVSRRAELASAERHAQWRALDQMQTLFRSQKRLLPEADVQAAMNALDDWWPHTTFSFGQRFRALRFGWYVLNLARDRQDRQAIAVIESALLNLRKEEPDEHVRRWIDEALQRAAPPERKLFGYGATLKNGRQIYVDFMANRRQLKAFEELDHDPTPEEIERIRTHVK